MENNDKKVRKMLIIEMDDKGQISVQVSNLLPHEVVGICKFVERQTLDFMSEGTHKIKDSVDKKDPEQKPTP